MALEIRFTAQFKKDYKRFKKRGYDLSPLLQVIQKLSLGDGLDERYDDHQLIGEYSGMRECHIKPDWLLIYCVNNKDLVLTVFRTGTHSDLF